jgi:hypothetical protein
MLSIADYLSTVPGGGYIGGCLDGVIKREPYKTLRDAKGVELLFGPGANAK